MFPYLMPNHHRQFLWKILVTFQCIKRNINSEYMTEYTVQLQSNSFFEWLQCMSRLRSNPPLRNGCSVYLIIGRGRESEKK